MINRKWLPHEDEILRSEYKRYGDAEKLQSRLQNRSTGSIIKRANTLGLKARRPIAKAYSIEELQENTVVNDAGCWLWTGDTRPKGYGIVTHAGKRISTHRLMFSLMYPDQDISGKLICHHCDNPLCINPAHLYAGSYADNNRDTSRRGRCRNQWSVPDLAGLDQDSEEINY